MLTLPHVVPERFRLELRPSYTRETNVRYYGLGNASPPGPQSELEYTRAHPTLRLRLETKATSAFRVRTGVQYTHDLLQVPDGTRLARDMQSGAPEVKALLGDARDHGVLLFEDTLLFDTRDDETWPTKGQWHQLQLRASPGGSGWFLYRYGQVDLTLRGYVTPIARYLTLAARATADVIVGHPPFYELARYEETNAVGGANGVRGVPANRYYGKVKVFGGIEARSELVPFRLFGGRHRTAPGARRRGPRLEVRRRRRTAPSSGKVVRGARRSRVVARRRAARLLLRGGQRVLTRGHSRLST
jgi:outer membrane protein assembly factor BamA